MVNTNGNKQGNDKPKINEDSETDNLINKLQNITEESISIKEQFIERHKKYEGYQHDKRRMNIIYENDFKHHLQKKLNKLDNRLNILQMKYNTYKKWYDRFNIIIIVISSLLSIFEALRNQIDDVVVEGTAFYYVFNMIPITISLSLIHI